MGEGLYPKNQKNMDSLILIETEGFRMNLKPGEKLEMFQPNEKVLEIANEVLAQNRKILEMNATITRSLLSDATFLILSTDEIPPAGE
jgi:hypothetical protein